VSDGGGYGACPACTCCFGMRAEVTGFDVVRLVDALGVDAIALVEASPDPVTTETSFYLDTAGDAFIAVLRRRADPFRCSLLVGPLGDGAYRCGVYAHRPLVCRAYPFELVDGAIGLRSPVRCPAGAWTAGPEADRAHRPELRLHTLESDVQRWLVRTWNWHVLTAADPATVTFEDHLAWVLGLVRPCADLLAPVTADQAAVEGWGRMLDRAVSPLDPRHLGTPAPPDGDPGLAPWWGVVRRVAQLLADAPVPPALARS
jgi:Fe-S-cluster containining protein